MKRYAAMMAFLLCLGGAGFVCEDAGLEPGPIHPAWVDSLITKFSAEPVGNPPQSIWQYTYNDATVYYVPPQCCDQFSDLYDVTGKIIGHPDGGITGEGDGSCRDFFKTATNGLVIWRDPRTRQ